MTGDRGAPTTDTPRRSDRRTTGPHLQQQFRKAFPDQSWWASTRNDKTVLWQAAATHGATLGWALRVADTTLSDVNLREATEVRWALQIAASVPVDVIDGLLAESWTPGELSSLLHNLPGSNFLDTARRLRDLHKAAPESGEPDGRPLWQALTAVVSAGPAGLTDLQMLRWLQVLTLRQPPTRTTRGIPRVILAISLAENLPKVLQEWVVAAGPDGWALAAAGYSQDEARLLLALPETHPDRPGPDQLAVMAALQQP